MHVRPRLLALTAAASAMVLLTSSPAFAAVIRNGEASQGLGVFEGVECPAPGSLVTSEQTDGHARVFRYTKAVGMDRCESRGIKTGGSAYTFRNNSTYWIGWEQNFSVVPGSGSDFVPFQWKSYPNSQQNYPVLMTVGNGMVQLKYVGPGEVWHTIWTREVKAFEWHRVALGIHTSDSASGGWIELYYDGIQRTFSNGSTRYTGRTWDSDNRPKWGAYDRGNTATEIINRVDRLMIGTSYADVG
ncbi:heparin lyase I family protein [Streptomyces sp. TRM66268-LWL]|uniref:Heparin lyase I family protein n=1 Tax=Streptomyces polyasparticus TaxID=2767826 RepID=A0ABR7SP14_9ACTN|nr:heparin lyase I family protein [Streptomyces polyasparticus]MBC9717225.1 heparin lyase I family protein [Streptomyces polyasparticus]